MRADKWLAWLRRRALSTLQSAVDGTTLVSLVPSVMVLWGFERYGLITAVTFQKRRTPIKI